MAMDFFDPLKEQLGETFSKIGKGTSKMFQGLFGGTDGPISMTSEYQTPAEKMYYQVQAGDTDMASVAQSNNVPLQDLVSNNGGAQSLPPVGSYIALRPEPQTQVGGYAAQYMQNIPTTGGSSPIQQESYRNGRGNPAYTTMITTRNNVNDAFNQFNESYRLTGQMDTSVLPQNITVSTVKALEQKGFFANAVDSNGAPLTPAAALTQYGYAFQNGKFVRTGAPGSANQQGPKAGQVMDGKFRAVWSASQGKLIWKKIDRTRRREAVAAPPPPAANAADTPTTVLGLNIGSG